MIFGVDVSDNNGNIDWAQVAAAGYKFAICKVTEGLGFADPTWPRNHYGALSEGLAVGGYHMLTPGDGAAQARFFLAHAGDLSTCLIPSAVDVEKPGLSRNEVDAWRAVVGGHRMIYLGNPAHDEIGTEPGWQHDPLWFPDYTQFEPVAPVPWAAMSIWQSSGGTVSVPGIGSCDIDLADPTWFASLFPKPPGAIMPSTARETNGGGAEEFFYDKPDGSVWHRYQDYATKKWSTDQPFGGPGTIDAGSLSGDTNGGRVILGALKNGLPIQRYQRAVAPTPVDWSPWTSTF